MYFWNRWFKNFNKWWYLFLSKVQKEFFDICYPFSNSDTRKFIQIYNKHKFSLRYDTQLEIKKFDLQKNFNIKKKIKYSLILINK